MLEGWFLWFILFWIVLLVLLMGIGGFFMFRKFLKRLPKQDGKSDMDWEEFFVKHTRDLWPGDDLKALLEDLVSPVPELFRDVARQKIAGKIAPATTASETPSPSPARGCTSRRRTASLRRRQ